MEILRPQNAGGLLRPCIKGKIRITTRCLWLDKGKLLDALHKAADAALSSCPVNCPLAHMERTVSEVLRKMVRKYSGKRPEVIAVAVENTTGVLSDELKARLSGESQDSFGLSVMNKAASSLSRKRGLSGKVEEADDGEACLSDDFVEESEGKGVEFEQLLSDNIGSPDLETPSSLTASADFFEPFGEPDLAKVENGSVLKEHQKSAESGNESSNKSLKAQPAASKTAKRNKWKPEEIKRLIKLRGKLDDRFQTVRGRMALWEELSTTLIEYGINRSAGQCKSLWASLVQKYEESRSGKKNKKSCPYFDDMDMILGVRQEATK